MENDVKLDKQWRPYERIVKGRPTVRKLVKDFDLHKYSKEVQGVVMCALSVAQASLEGRGIMKPRLLLPLCEFHSFECKDCPGKNPGKIACKLDSVEAAKAMYKEVYDALPQECTNEQ